VTIEVGDVKMISVGSKKRRPSASECEYLVGDDSCGAIKESEIGTLRAERCRNDVKDACCYLCCKRRKCDISCDLLKHQGARGEMKGAQSPRTVKAFDPRSKFECGNCVHYLKPECSRGYINDAELWRKQDPCEIFQPKKSNTGSCMRGNGV
jgi:hypothetical protein